jgi:hypothetical protein
MNARTDAAPAVPAGALLVSYRFADLRYGDFERTAWARGFLRLRAAPLAMWLGVAVVSFAGALAIGRLAGPAEPRATLFVMTGSAIGAVALFAGLILRWTALARERAQRERQSGYRRGMWRVLLDPGGIRVTADHLDCRYGWGAVEGTVQARTGLLLIFGCEHWVALPDAALPAGMTRAEVLDLVHGWMHGRVQPPASASKP